ncbi:MAG: type IV secretion system DNA-binding domain-containing protein [Candidatus Tectimicrobiota bacterium]
MRLRYWDAILLAALGSMATLALALVPPTPWAPQEHRPLTLALLGGWTLWRLGVLVQAWARQRAWQQAPVWHMDTAALPLLTAWAWLPERVQRWLRQHGWLPHRGVVLGRAFRWNARDTQLLETVLAEAGALPVAEDARGGHPALHAVGQSRERTLVLPWSELTGHVLITGTTRSGKTRLLEVLAAEVIRGPGAVLILDPKGDRDLLARCAAEAQRQGRPFACLSPAFPAQSARLNVLDTAGTPAEVAARIKALMPSGGARQGDPFFEEYPLALIERLATVQQALGQRWTLEGLYAPAVLRQHLEALLAAYLRQRLQVGAGQRLEALIAAYTRQGAGDLVADALIDDLQKPRDHFTKVTSNLIPAFRGVVGAPLGPLFSTVPGDLSWTRIVDQSQVVYVALASLLLGDVANRIGRVLLQDLVGYLGRRYAYDEASTAPPITVLIDEFGDVAFPLFTNALNKGGGAQARFMLAQQSLADAEAAMGPAQARRVLDNLNTKIWCRLADDRTAAEATEGLGLCTVCLPEDGVGLSYGGMGGLTGSVQRRLTAREVPLVRPAWLTALPRGEALVRMKGEVWKLRVPLLTPPAPAVLEQLGLGALLSTLPAPSRHLPPPG